MFWQLSDGAEILHGHFPATVSYAISSGPLISQEWLYEAAMAWFAQHGAYGVFVVVCGVAAAITPLIAYAAARAFGIGDLGSGIAAFLVVGSRFAASAVRPETFAVDAFGIELILLASLRRIWLIVPCAVLWSNIHASAILAPILAALFAGGTAIAHGRVDAQVRKALGIAALAAAATLATPYGFRLWSYAFALALGSNPVRMHLEVWRPLAFDVPGSIAAVLPGLLVLLCCGVVFSWRYVGEISVAAVCFALTLTHARYEVFLAVGWAPVIARTLEQRTPLGRIASRQPRAPALALAPLAIFALVAGAQALRVPLEMKGPWQAAASLAEKHDLAGNAYAPYLWAAYLHWRGLPLRLLIDAHGDPYSSEVWNDHLALQDVHPNWRDVLKRRAIDVVFADADAPLAGALRAEPSWQLVGEQGGIDVFALRARSATAR